MADTPFMYADLTFATTYLEDHFFANAWVTADNATRSRALRHATRIIDNASYKYTPADTDHAFPLLGQSTVPVPVQEACVEIALALLDGINPEEVLENLSIIKHQIGPISVVKDPKLSAIPFYIYHGIPSYRAGQRLAPYLLMEPPSGSIAIRV